MYANRTDTNKSGQSSTEVFLWARGTFLCWPSAACLPQASGPGDVPFVPADPSHVPVRDSQSAPCGPAQEDARPTLSALLVTSLHSQLLSRPKPTAPGECQFLCEALCSAGSPSLHHPGPTVLEGGRGCGLQGEGQASSCSLCRNLSFSSRLSNAIRGEVRPYRALS